MGIVFSNNGSTTLNGAITNNATSIIVTATSSFPTVGGGNYFYATLIAQDGTREIVKCTALTSQTYTVVRAQDDTGVTPDTTGYAFADGDRFQLRLPKVVLEDHRDRIAVNETDLAGTTNAGTVPAPATTNMFFYQAAAPTNWTIYTTVEDCLLAVKGGSNAYNIAGGTGAEAGSWTPSTHTHTMNTHYHDYSHTHGQAAHIHTMPSHAHTMQSHTHTGPSHTHTGSVSGTTSEENTGGVDQGSGSNNAARENHTHTFSDSFTTAAGGTGNTGAPSTANTSSVDPGDTNSTDAGSTNSQSATNTAAVDPGDTNAGSPVSTDRPLAAVGILATKD
jgi:hypothetical protein